MSVPNPTILYVLNDSSGKTVVNDGSNATDGAINASGSCVENTNFSWHHAAGSYDGYWESHTAKGAGQAFIDTAITGLATNIQSAVSGIGLATAFSIDGWSTPYDNAGWILGTPTGDKLGDLTLRVTPNGGGYDLNIRFNDSATVHPEQGKIYTALTLGTVYQLVAVWDCTTTSAAVLKTKLDSAAVDTSTSEDHSTGGSASVNSTTGWIGRASGFADHYGIDGRVYYYAYNRWTRGVDTVWSSSDMAAIQSDPKGTITGWPGGADVTAPTYGANPAKTANTNTTATFSATASDETDTAVDHYIGIYTSGNTPTAAQIKAGNGTGFVAGASASNVTNGVSTNYGGAISGLTGSVAYDAWATVEEHGSAKTLHAPYQVAFTTACTLSSPLGAMDATTGTSGNTASGGITVTGTTGTAYWYLSNSGTPPSVANLKSGSGSLTFGNSTITTAGAIAYANKGSLAEKTNYWFHYVVNQNSQDSTISSSASFQATDAPTLSSGTGTATAGTTADLSVLTNRTAGTAYVVVTTSITQPTTAQIKAGQTHLGAAAPFAASDASVSSTQTFSATGLTASTGYYAHFYQEDGQGDGSNRHTSNSFTTFGVGTYNVDIISPGVIRPGDTATVTISGAWAASGKTATLNGHPLTLATQSAATCTFVVPTLHTNPTYNDTQYSVAVQFVLTDGAFQGTKNCTITAPSGYDFVNITAVSGIYADDTGVAIGDDHLGHWTVGTADVISSTGILSNITGYPATYVYWRFDESEHVWTASATETFYEIVEFDGTDYGDQIYYDNAAITLLDLSTSFNDTTANITAYAQTGDAVPGLSLNTSTGALTGTPTTPAIYQYTVSATDSDNNVAFANTFNITVYGIPVWESAPAPTYTDGDAVSLSLASFINADGLSPAVSWSQLAGTYPSDLTLDTVTGIISGTLASSASQSSPYTGHQYRATNPSGDGDSDTFDITVLPLAPVFTGTIPTIPVSGGGAITPVDVSSYFTVYIDSYAFDAAVPAGIVISSVGVISGEPTTFGTFPVTITATNASGTATSNSFNIVSSPEGISFTGNITNKGPYAINVAITPIDVTAQWTGGAGTYAFKNGTRPPGIDVSSAGVISGTPTIAGVYSGLRITKTNAAGSADSNAFTVTVVGGLPTIIAGTLPNRTNFIDDVISVDFRTLIADETTIAVTNLPTGLSDASGVVTGTVTTAQSKTVTVTATNGAGSIAPTFTWLVSSDIPVLSNAVEFPRATDAIVRVTTNRPTGTLYWVVTLTATTPSVAQIKAGQNAAGAAGVDAGNQSVTYAGEQSATADGLSALATYYVHWVHNNASGDSNRVTSASWATHSGEGGGGSPFGFDF